MKGNRLSKYKIYAFVSLTGDFYKAAYTLNTFQSFKEDYEEGGRYPLREVGIVNWDKFEWDR